jgi:hypothetical protein
MVVNVYVVLPAGIPVRMPATTFLGAAADLARVLSGRSAALGAPAVTGAGFNGVGFLDYWHPLSSMIMTGPWARCSPPRPASDSARPDLPSTRVRTPFT